jgi:hypothetical protein
LAEHIQVEKRGAKAPIPHKKTDEGNLDFKALHSDHMVGQIAGGGWSPQAKVALNKIIQHIATTRSEDREKGYACHKIARGLIQQKYNITDPNAVTPARKRKHHNTVTPPEQHIDIIEIQDDDEE